MSAAIVKKPDPFQFFTDHQFGKTTNLGFYRGAKVELWKSTSIYVKDAAEATLTATLTFWQERASKCGVHIMARKMHVQELASGGHSVRLYACLKSQVSDAEGFLNFHSFTRTTETVKSSGFYGSHIWKSPIICAKDCTAATARALIAKWEQDAHEFPGVRFLQDVELLGQTKGGQYQLCLSAIIVSPYAKVADEAARTAAKERSKRIPVFRDE